MEMSEDVRLGLVKYQGKKGAPFTVEVAGIHRLWAAIPSVLGAPVQPARWLPESEAKAYGAMPNFAVTKWGSHKKLSPRVRAKATRRQAVAPPPTAAKPLEDLAAALDRLEKTLPDVEPEEFRFSLSSSGMVHRVGCPYEAKSPEARFYTIDEAAAHPRFKKFHKCVE